MCNQSTLENLAAPPDLLLLDGLETLKLEERAGDKAGFGREQGGAGAYQVRFGVAVIR